MPQLTDELREEIADLTNRGFVAAWIGDLKVGDIFAGPRFFSSDPPRALYAVERLMSEDHEYLEPSELDEDDGTGEMYVSRNRVVNMIVRDENDLQRHLSYGSTHDIYIWRP